MGPSADHPLDAITVDELRASGAVKWTRFGPDALGAFVAEMDFGTAPEVVAALHRAVDDAAFGYLPTSRWRAMSEGCAAWQASTYGWDVRPEQVHPMADVIRGLELAMEHFSEPGSAVVLPTPAYMPFFEVPLTHGREIITVPSPVHADGRSRLDLDGIRAALAGRGNLLVLCNPHNPTGRVYERAELEALAEVVEAQGGRVFADEIHSPLVYEPGRHIPYASISPIAAGHTVTATSASKAWNLAGLKCAQLIISNDADAAVWERVGPTVAFGAATLGVIANTAAYTEGREWLAWVTDYLDGSRRLLAELVAEHLPGVGYVPPEGTYLTWLDCRALELGDDLGQRFLDHGVALVDGARCGHPGFVRLNIATPRPILTEVVRRMSRAATVA